MTVLTELLPVLLPILVAGLTTVLFEKFQQGITALDRAPALVKQVTVALLAYGLTKAAAFLGVTLTTGDPGALTPQDFNALLSSGLAFLFHHGAKVKTMAAKMGAVALLVGLAACGPAIAGAKPGLALSVGGDEVIVRATCDTDAPNVACLISVTDSISGQVVASESRVDRGQTLTLPSRTCSAAGPVVYVGTFVGVTASGRRSAAATGTGRATCDPAGGAPRPSIVVEIRPGGL